MDPQDQFIQVGNIRTRYWQLGRGASTVVLLHGIGCSVEEWNGNAQTLAEQHRVLVLDILGFGLTDKPAGETYTMQRLGRFILDFMSALGVERAHLAGHSMGGRLALECALQAPPRVRSLLLVAPAGIGRKCLMNFRIASLPGLGELLTRPSRFGLKSLWRLAVHDPRWVTAPFVQARYQLACQPGAQAAFLKTLRGFVGLGGFPNDQIEVLQAALPGISVPVQVVWGRQDKLLPVGHAAILAQRLPQVVVTEYEACGHLPQLEHAQRFNAQALAFLARQGSAG